MDVEYGSSVWDDPWNKIQTVGNCPHRNLEKEVELATSRGGVGEHNLTTVGSGSEKLRSDKVIKALIADLSVARICAIEVLGKKNLTCALCLLGFLNFLVKY